MKLFISADIEGITGVTAWQETKFGGQGYDAARTQMTLEVGAACSAATQLGYEVFVKDAHEDAINIDIAALPQGVKLIKGWMNSPASMMAGLDDSFDAAAYIGYHSPAGSNTSPLAHTIDHSLYNFITVNGRLSSEFSLNALWALEHQVPSVFISGDEGICKMAKESHPDIVTVATKTGIGNATCNIHPEDALEQIKVGMKKALGLNISLSSIENIFKMVINFKEHKHARRASWYPGAKQIDSHSVEYTASTICELAVARMFLSEV